MALLLRFRFIIKLVLTLMLVQSVFGLQAQDSTKYKSILILKADILIPTISAINGSIVGVISAEKFLRTRHSVQLRNAVLLDIYPCFNTRFLYEFIPQYRYFLRPKNKGLYTGAYLKCLWNADVYQQEGYRSDLIGLSAGGLFGWQTYLFQDKMVIDIGLGIGVGKPVFYKNKEGENEETIFLPSRRLFFDGLLGINIGYNFQKK